MATKPTKAASATTAAPAQAQTQAVVNWDNYTGVTGLENVQQSDLGIPFLTILQSKSAEVDKTHKDYATKKMEGAEAGDIINTVARRVIAKAEKAFIRVIPAFYEKTYVEWKQNRGGLVKVHRNPAIMDEVTGRDEKNQPILKNGNLILETASFYVLLLNDDGSTTPAIINMASTQLKNARLWLNLATGIKVGPQRITPPLFSHIYILSTVIERKDNNSWYGWKIQLGDTVTNRAYVEDAGKIVTRARLAITNTPALPAGHEADEVPM